jgi:hypothetical protein
MSLKIENSRRVAESRPVECTLKDKKKLHDFVTVYNMIETDCKHIFKKTMLLLYLHQRPLFQLHIFNPRTGW